MTKLEFCHCDVISNFNYLSTSCARILPLFKFLMAFLMRLVVTPKCKGFCAKRAGDGPAAAEVLAVLVRLELGALRVSTTQRTGRIGRKS